MKLRNGGSRRTAASLVLLLVAAALLVFSYARLLRGLAAVLVVNDPVEPSSAIVVLAGGVPFREVEAATLYRDGLAPRIILVPERQNREAEWRARGLRTTTDIRREILVRQGVPSEAVLILPDDAVATIDELEIAARAIAARDRPVLLVTSQFHSRRVGLTWLYVTGGHPRGIVRSAREDPLTPDRWWRDPASIRSVLWEYAGLFDLGVRVVRSRIPA